MTLPRFILPLLLRLHAFGMSRPFYDLGGYMHRGWVMGYHSAYRNDGNPGWHGRTLGRLHDLLLRLLCIRAHTTLRSDNDRHNHDHPCPSISVVLDGGMWEVLTPNYAAQHRPHTYATLIEQLPFENPALMADVMRAFNVHWRGPGAVVFRNATDAHRLILPVGTQCKTLFVMGPKRRDHVWGFYTPHGKVPHGQYLAYLEARRAA